MIRHPFEQIRYLLLNLLCIPDLKALLHFILKGLVTSKIEGLQLVSAICRHINMVNVVLLKKLIICRDLLAPEDIKNCNTWMILFKAQDLPFFLGNESRILSVYLIIVASLDQWFSVYATHPTQAETQLLNDTFLFCPGGESEEVDILQQVSLL